MKFCVIGLGRFGYSVAAGLAANGMEVMAIDNNESIVASIRNQVTHAICMRASDEASLRSLGIEEMDTVIVTVGENFSQSILITAILKKKLNVPQVITRAIHEVHKEILQLIGADRVILPEQEIGTKLADQLSFPFMDLIRISKDFSINKMPAPTKFVGKTLQEVEQLTHHKIRCIGIERNEDIETIEPDYVIHKGDKLVFSGSNDGLEAITKW